MSLRGSSTLTFLVAGIVVAPLLTAGLDFRAGLVVRAVCVATLTVAVAALAVAHRGWASRLAAAPRAVVIGVACWTGATVLGAIVAVVRGNQLALIAGQLLSMGLLPVACVAGLALPDGLDLRRRLSTGVVGAVAVGALAQISWWAWSLSQGLLQHRFYLPNMASVVAPALLALLLAVALGARPERRLRILAGFGAVTTLLIIVASAVRALWALTVPALLLLAVLWPGWLRRLGALGWGLVIAVLTVVGGGNMWLEHRFATPERNLVAEPPSVMAISNLRREERIAALNDPEGALTLHLPRPPGYVSALLPLDGPGTYLLRGRFSASGSGSARLMVYWALDQGRVLSSTGVRIWADEQDVVKRRFSAPPQRARCARLHLRPEGEADGAWRIEELALWRVGPASVEPLLRQREIWVQRLTSLAVLVGGELPRRDPALEFRLTESSRVLGAVSASPWWSQLLGHGLGATVHIGRHGFDNRGNWIYYDDVNYIHNFYLFLLYKLGAVGGLLAVVALLLWLGHAVAARRAAGDEWGRAFAAAAATAWAAYCAWSVTSPEILDFRMAPLWGLLVASAVADRRGRSSTEPGGPQAGPEDRVQ